MQRLKGIAMAGMVKRKGLRTGRRLRRVSVGGEGKGERRAEARPAELE